MTTPIRDQTTGDATTGSGAASVIEVAQETLAAEAQTAACIGVPVEEVVAWVLSWDTPDELPTPIARKLD
jgi:hypothetical protein